MTTEIPTGYKQTSVGIIPEDWEMKKLGDITTKIGSGITPLGGEKVYKRFGRPFLRSQNVGWGVLLLNDISFLDEELHNSFKSTELKFDDVLLNITGASIGRSAIVDERIVGGNVNQHVCIIRTKKEVLKSNFLNAFLLSHKGQNYIDNFQSGGNRQGLNFEQIKSFKIPLPPLPEQQKIAEILSTWDKAIETCQKTIEELKLRNKGLAQQLLSGKTRVKGFEDAVWKFIKIGEILSESVIPSINESDPDKRITVKLNLNGIEKRDFRGTEVEGATYFYTRKAGQFIYGKQNLHKGAFGIIPDELDNFDSSSDIPSFDFSEKFSPRFILYYFSRKSFYERLENYSTGTGSKRIQPKELFKVEIKIPDFEEQKRIVEILDTAASELKHYEEKLQNLKLQKKGLMQVLLTGKVRTI